MPKPLQSAHGSKLHLRLKKKADEIAAEKSEAAKRKQEIDAAIAAKNPGAWQKEFLDMGVSKVQVMGLFRDLSGTVQ